MTNTDLVRQLRTASVQCDEMRLRDFGYLMKQAADAIATWNPHTIDGGTISNIPHSYDGKWIIVTDGKSVSVERIKKDAYDHFFPAGRWFSLEDVTHWMPLPEPPKEVNK